MSYSPASIPVAYPISVTDSLCTVTLPSNAKPKLGALLLQRAGDSANVFLSFDSGLTDTTGVLVSKGGPQDSNPYLIPAEVFETTKIFYLIGDAAGPSTVDCVIV